MGMAASMGSGAAAGMGGSAPYDPYEETDVDPYAAMEETSFRPGGYDSGYDSYQQQPQPLLGRPGGMNGHYGGGMNEARGGGMSGRRGGGMNSQPAFGNMRGPNMSRGKPYSRPGGMNMRQSRF